MGYIYKILSPSGKLYVGQTYSIKQRISDYKCLRYRSKKSIIIASIKKYGWAAHKLEVIECCEDSEMDNREIFWIKELNTLYPNNPLGMNLTAGGGGCRMTWKHDKERVAKAKLRSGVNAPSFGKKVSPEVKAVIAKKVSEYNLLHGRKPSDACRMASIKVTKKPVLRYDLNGNFLSEHESCVKASKDLKIDRKSIVDASNGNQYQAGGFVFRKKNGEIELKINVHIPNLQLKKIPILCFKNNELVGEFESFDKLSNSIGVSKLSIKDAFYGNRTMRNGYKFEYKKYL